MLDDERKRYQQNHRRTSRSKCIALGGAGLVESVYEEALGYELKPFGCEVRRQAPSPIQHQDVTLAAPLRIDLLVKDLVIIECKAFAQHRADFATQGLTYLRLRNLK